MTKRRIVVPPGGDEDGERSRGPLRRFNDWLSRVGESIGAFSKRAKNNYGNILSILFYSVMLLAPIILAVIQLSDLSFLHNKERETKVAPTAPPDASTIDQLRKQQTELIQTADQLEERLSRLSASDVSKQLESFESQISALDTYIGELFEPKKGKDVLIVKSIVDDLRQLREKSSGLEIQIDNHTKDRIRIETKIDAVQSDQRTLLHWVLSLGGLLFLGLLLGVRYIGKKIEPLILAPSLLKSTDQSKTEDPEGG